ncbi:MAG: hypothetical protein COX39_01120 [Candidatus Nealsonbacteria bacterium CG23_combo_of_CG06-09_8_20_14_all_40_13]|uniref:Glycosyltransferase RgtA/B/C/D-like domain-containing protein n=1 Tax=Candidatus Nealsonbacteria bacterium CG23_combo_of_CG06-09_8_20_14_all_40_13 TaxID=1974724 RepID=A0A2G9YST4_9BACT|nr:MAG: hypothetical protein COX39_01120 [Candidatus Nealsonbacteria bacterium CG23_combo_of_CG06-09_8_20_14_all_40_13]PIR70793.1 MAG: hypothetical protein COU44_03115 [Candidatus Nealsonbacteria bacterium CG10_big_fil_rev_8_21_14_0_10_40_24]PIU43559.1 MAG: hypothetical protein COS97_00370 [Candidatus Nealsonbacteria bacterium CG07_land_8_20_14_0_80_40_10]
MLNNKKSFWIALFFLVLIFIFLGPVIFYPTSYLSGLSGDPFGILYSFFWQKYAFLNHLNPNFNSLLNFPFGVDYSSPLPQSLAGIFAKYLSILFNEVVAYNLIIFSSFVLTFIFGYWLVFKFINNKTGALLSATIITFAPYHLAHASQHLILANIHWLVLFVLVLLNMSRKPTWVLGILAAVSFSLTVLDGYLYGFFALVVLAVWILTKLIWAVICKEMSINRKNLLIYLCSVVFALAIIQIFSPNLIKNILKNPTQIAESTGTKRTYEELSVYSARTYNFLLPPSNNPIFGKYTKKIYEQDIAQPGSNVTEQTLYLGWTPIILALLGLFLYFKNKKFRQERFSFLIIFSILLALAGFYFSFAPTISIFGLKIRTPAAWLFNFMPFIRVYARFGLLVVISVATLAGLGLSLILKSVGNAKLKYFLFFIFYFLILLEFANFSPWPVVDVSQKAMPAVYQWLKEQRGNDWAVAEYPLLSTEEDLSYNYLLWQRFHQKPLIYGAKVNSVWEEKRKEIVNIESSETIAKLKERKVKFVIIHQGRFTPENAQKYPAEYNLGQTPHLSQVKNLKFLANFGNAEVYQIY